MLRGLYSTLSQWLQRPVPTNLVTDFGNGYQLERQAKMQVIPSTRKVATWLGFLILWVFNFILCSFATLGFFY
jgi:hypothetical protein